MFLLFRKHILFIDYIADHSATSKCTPGNYGPKCDKVCPVNCKTCENAKSCIKCNDGWHGDLCQSICPPKCGGSCFQNRFCYVLVNFLNNNFIYNGTENAPNLNAGNYNRKIDRCNSSMINCKFCHDDSKNPCRECTTGWHGYLCNAKCSNNCDTTLGCHRDTGYCLRPDIPNPDEYLGAIVACDASMVNCKLCRRGLIDCGECKIGWFGNACKKKCPTWCDDTVGCTRQFGSCLRVGGKSFVNC